MNWWLKDEGDNDEDGGDGGGDGVGFGDCGGDSSYRYWALTYNYAMFYNISLNLHTSPSSSVLPTFYKRNSWDPGS